MTNTGEQGSVWQGNEWQGRVGDAWAHEWRRTDRSFSDLTRQLNAEISSRAPASGKAIDLGCGAGETSIALAKARPDLSVSGVDLSEGLVKVATERGGGIANLDFRVGDTAALSRDTAADFFISRHGVMFFPDPVAAFRNILLAATPGANIVFSCFADRALNRWALILDAVADQPAAAPVVYNPGPFGFADRDMTARMLADAGWVGAEATEVDFTYIAGAGPDAVADATSFFSRIGPVARTLADASPDHRAILLDRLANALAAAESGGQITFPAAAWIWTARAGERA